MPAAGVTFCTDCEYYYAWIVCPDGTKSEKFATAPKGLRVLRELVAAGRVSGNEMPELTQVIWISSLQNDDPELDEVFAAMTKEKDGALAALLKAQRTKEMNKRSIWNSSYDSNGKRILH